MHSTETFTNLFAHLFIKHLQRDEQNTLSFLQEHLLFLHPLLQVQPAPLLLFLLLSSLHWKYIKIGSIHYISIYGVGVNNFLEKIKIFFVFPSFYTSRSGSTSLTIPALKNILEIFLIIQSKFSNRNFE